MAPRNANSIEEFTVKLDEFRELMRARTRRFAVEFIQDLNEAVIEATPHRTGFLRASWYAQLNSIPEGRSDGSGGVATMNLAGAGIELGDVYYAVNGAAYAWIVEFGSRAHPIFPKTKKALHWVEDGSSRFAKRVMHPGTAPRAFVRGTMDRAPMIAQTVLARIASP